MLLDIEARIGELLPPKEEALKTACIGGSRQSEKATLKDGQGAGELLPPKEEALKTAFTGGKRQKRLEGLTDRRAVQARAIFRHSEIVELEGRVVAYY